MAKVKLQLHRRRDLFHHGAPWNDGRRYAYEWTAALPFVMSPLGKLVHRIKRGKTHLRDGKPSHTSVDYWCNGGGCERVLLSEPPKDRLLCIYCEQKAVAAGEKPADELVGHHVHKGSLRPHRECCRELEN